MRKMVGEIRGSFYKIVMNTILTADLAFPDLSARVKLLNDNTWYSHDEYLKMLQTVGSKVSQLILKNIGRKLLITIKPRLMTDGFLSTESILQDVWKPFNAQVRNIPIGAYMKTIEYHKGKAIVGMQNDQPPAYTEGLLVGSVTAYGNTVRKITSKVEGDWTIFTIEW